MPRKFFRKYLPTQAWIQEHRFLGRFGAWLHHPNLWHLNRRSVAGGVAIGLFCGLIPGPLQMPTALLIAMLWRVNLPVSLFTTLYTNPLTLPPLYFAAYYIGRVLIGGEGGAWQDRPGFAWSDLSGSMQALAAWLISLGKPLALGLAVLALLLAGIGYFGVQLAWRMHVARAWRRRREVRQARSKREAREARGGSGEPMQR